MDAALVDARDRSDAAGTDAGPDDRDGGREDAIPVADARVRVDAAVDPAECAEALAGATEIGPAMTGSTSTCSMVDVVDFDCIGTTGTDEAYYYVNATTDVTVTLSGGGFVFSRVDPTDCSLISCGHTTLPIGADGRVYFVVEYAVAGGCGATYSLSAISGSS